MPFVVISGAGVTQPRFFEVIMKGIKGLTLRERLDVKARQKQNGCIEWTGAVLDNGYGQVRYQGAKLYVHRAAWIAANGPIPEGQQVCHHCDNKICINPEHLFIGTQYDNMQDMIQKGRKVAIGRPGSKNHKAKLSESDVARIRNLYENAGLTRKELCALYGISKTAMQRILTRAGWEHVN